MRASEFMYFAYLDEFGHIGPYVERRGRKHNESPVFGLAGIILPETAVRPFATFFLKQKECHFAADLENSGKMAAKWEKKGTSFIRPKTMKEYVEARRLLHRVMKKVDSLGGSTFFYGREKKRGLQKGLNPTGLYTTCLAHALRRLDKFCEQRNESFIAVIDQHSARKELLECAAKTMFGSNPCRRLASPPFEVESYLNQNIQAADWIATLVGRIKAYETCPDEFEDYANMHKLFSERLHGLSQYSDLEKRPNRRSNTSKSGPFESLAEFREQLVNQSSY